MGMITSRLTVFFEDPFWVGVCQRESEGLCTACRVVFGAEPKDYEVYDYFLTNFTRLRFSPPVQASEAANPKPNPKRMQRAIQAQFREPGAGSKAQQALKLLQEQDKTARKTRGRAEREAEKARRYAQREEKRKEKHRGH